MSIASVDFFTRLNTIDKTVYDICIEASDDGGRIGIRPQAGHVYGVLSPTIESCARAAYWAMGHERPYTSFHQPARTRKDIRQLKRDVRTILAENDAYIASATDGELTLCCTSGGSFALFTGVEKSPDGTVTHDRNGQRVTLTALDVAESGVYCSAREHVLKMNHYLNEVGHEPACTVGDYAILVALPLRNAEHTLERLVAHANARSDHERAIVHVTGRLICSVDMERS